MQLFAQSLRQLKKARTGLLLASAIMAGCGGSGSDSSTPAVTPPPADDGTQNQSRTFQVDIINLTAGQPFSPVFAATHDADYQAFTIGEAASSAVEDMAETGDIAGLFNEISNHGTAVPGGETGPVLSGESRSFELVVDADDVDNIRLTVLTMLINTNDAFTGVNALDLSSLEAGQRLVHNGVAYDAGTEVNSEATGTFPGPGLRGVVDVGSENSGDSEGSVVTMHNGVITQDDGLPSSILRDINRFDNPVARITVTRTE